MAEVSATNDYNEAVIRSRVEGLPGIRRVAFASACAEWLVECYQEFAARSSQGDPERLRSALNMAWALADGDSLGQDMVDNERVAAELLVPNDQDDDWSDWSPIAQNAAAAVAYALRTALLDDPQQAVWGARQLYEAGDYLIQVGGAVRHYADNNEVNGPLELSAKAIAAALEQADDRSISEMRSAAEQGGQQLRQMMMALL